MRRSDGGAARTAEDGDMVAKCKLLLPVVATTLAPGDHLEAAYDDLREEVPPRPDM